MSERFKEHDWKSCDGGDSSGGSNPLLCANKTGKAVSFPRFELRNKNGTRKIDCTVLRACDCGGQKRLRYFRRPSRARRGNFRGSGKHDRPQGGYVRARRIQSGAQVREPLSRAHSAGSGFLYQLCALRSRLWGSKRSCTACPIERFPSISRTTTRLSTTNRCLKK